MYKLLLIIFAVFTVSLVKGQTTASNLDWPKPANEAKPYVRWWWFGSEVTKPDIEWNLEQLSKAGIGGAEITPIYGVKGKEKEAVSFLSTEYMDILAFTINSAKKLGMGIDMATGTGWPFGGPNITTDNAASKFTTVVYSAKKGNLFTRKIQSPDKGFQNNITVQAVMAFSNKGAVKNLLPLMQPDGTVKWLPDEGDWKVVALIAGKTMQKVKRAAPGGEGLVMDHFSANAFDTYTERFNKAFADSKCPAPVTFFNDSYEVYDANWSPVFLDEFKKRRGYDLQNYLNLFAGIGDSTDVARVKSDYRETMAELLLENFTKRWTDWAHSKGAITRNQAHGSPGNLLDLYGTVDIPECESFGTTFYNIPGLRHDTGFIRSGDADPMMLKFASSGAHISGKKFVSSETFTWLGEHFRVSLSQTKPQLDDIFTSGINHVFFHGSPFSPKDAAWPGYEFYASVNFSSFNRFWHDIPAMTSYIQRCQSFLQMGQPDNDFLLYFPIYDLWNNNTGYDMPLAIHNIDKWLHKSSFYKDGKAIMDMGYDLDYISDRFIKNATVKNNMIVSGGNTYKALVIPSCQFMPLETFKAILQLAKEGANVIIEDFPTDVPGFYNLKEKYTELKNMVDDLSNVPMESRTQMKPYGNGKLAVGNPLDKMIGYLNLPKEGIFEHNVRFIRRKDADGYHYFFANLQSQPLDSWVNLAVDAQSAVLFNPQNGESGVAAIRKQDGRTQVRLQLQPGESVVLRTFSNKPSAGKNWAYIDKTGNASEIKEPWKLTMTEGVPAIAATYTLKSLQSWTALKDSNLIKFSGTGKYSTEIILPEGQAGDWVMNLGDVRESARIYVNGNYAGTLWCVPFSIRIGKFLKPGKNTIEVEVTNIDANRIADYDRRGVPWKIFNDINVVNVNYKPFDAKTWEPMPSGLLGPVTLTPVN